MSLGRGAVTRMNDNTNMSTTMTGTGTIMPGTTTPRDSKVSYSRCFGRTVMMPRTRWIRRSSRALRGSGR